MEKLNFVQSPSLYSQNQSINFNDGGENLSHELIHSKNFIAAFSQRQLNNLKFSFSTSNDVTSPKEDRDDGKTGNIGIEVSKGKDSCSINLDIFTAKVMKADNIVNTLAPGFVPISNNEVTEGVIDKEKGERTDLATIGCSREIFEFSGLRFENSIKVGAFLEGTGDLGGSFLQDATHAARGFNEVNLPYSKDSSSTFGVTAGFEGKKHVLGEALSFTTNIDGKVGFDSTGQLQFIVKVGGVTKFFNWNIWLENGIYKLGDNIVLQNAIQNNGKYERTGFGIEKNIGSIEIGLYFTKDSMNDNKDELGLKISKSF